MKRTNTQSDVLSDEEQRQFAEETATANDRFGTGKTHVASESPKRPEDYKTSVKSLQFDLKSKESRSMLVGLVDELHQQSVLFSLRQDFNLVWVEL